METASLKSFATWARTALIRDVTARIAVVLAPASPERVEQPRVVAALEKAVDAAGGGGKGRSAVADRVAYTWFNRIIALRFMDANGYTGIGVVSPQAGTDVGQPEILAEAKRANIDAEVVRQKARETVTGLLNGTRRSDDPQGETYALLLAEYCRHWNRSMPFMFEREGDFTELLIPANLLADDSVLNRAAKVLTADVCQDVEVIGWLYQFYISERKDEVFAGFKKNQRAGAAEIPAATQLFTPHWIVRYLVENSLGRLWMLNRPNSRLIDQMEFYIAPVDAETDFVKINSPEELKVIDPACGSGHMLTYAFDLFSAIYEEEGYAPSDIPGLILTNNLFGTEIDTRAGALAAFALTMKARASQRRFFTKMVEPHVCVLEPIAFSPAEIDLLVTPDGDTSAEAEFWNQFQHADTLGALIRVSSDRLPALVARLDAISESQHDLLTSLVLTRASKVLEYARVLSGRYQVLVANPPYMGSGNMDQRLAEYGQIGFPVTKSDLYAMFIERSFEMVGSLGYSAMVTMESWMFLPTYADMRSSILSERSIKDMVHMPYLGKGSTSMGINFGTAATIIKNSREPRSRATFQSIRYFETDDRGVPTCFPVENERATVVSPERFCDIPGSPIAYWLSDAVRSAFALGRPLMNEVALREGLTTGDNGKYLRYWWEVSAIRSAMRCVSRDEALASGARWFPHKKGGPFRRWYGNQYLVINWESDGAEIKAAVVAQYGGSYTKSIRSEKWYFEPALSWGRVSSGEFSIRRYPAGQLFDSTAPSVLASQSAMTSVLALLNSSSLGVVLTAISPTLDFRLTAMGNLPMPHGWKSLDTTAVSEATDVSREDWDNFETSWNFAVSPLLSARTSKLASVVGAYAAESSAIATDQRARETKNNRIVAEAYGLVDEVPIDVPLHRVSLTRNVEFRYGPGRSPAEYATLERADVVADLVSYAVGCMFGRYSLDEPGLIQADQGATVQDYLAKVPNPTFAPDKDNVIPIVDGEWFEDDVVARFRQFLRTAFGEQHFEENLRFVTASLEVKDLRDYFVKSFFKDHVQRYKKRPIYWLFSSPKGSFNALVYMHRYTPSTVSTVLNEYLREYKAKLGSSLQHHERLAISGGTPREQAAAQKESDRLRKVLLELDEYEHNVLYPLASQQISIDLDDGVKTNYPKFGAALKKIPGLEVVE
jgi:hypothetical protein